MTAATRAKSGDRVYTPQWLALDMLQHFQPEGLVLEPCRGDGAFTRHRPGWSWCELDEGRDFFDWSRPVDWVFTNPPYSKLRPFFMHSARVAREVCLLIPLRNYFSGYGFVRDAREFGDLVHIRLYGTGGNCGFPMGNAIGACHWSRGYRGPTGWSDGSRRAIQPRLPLPLGGR